MIIWDTETTGLVGPIALPLSKQPRIIEFAGIKVDNKTHKEVGRLEFMCRQPTPLTAEIVGITGITDKMLSTKKTFAEHLPELADFFLGETISIAHNLAFDTSMLSMELQRLDYGCRFPWPFHQICTVVESHHLRGHRLSLTKLHNFCFGKDFPSAHRAMADVEALTKCTLWLIKNNHLQLP